MKSEQQNQECGHPSITERRYAHLSLDQLDSLRERLDKEFNQVDNLRRFIRKVCSEVENTPYFPSGHKWDCKREKVRYSIQAVYEDLVDLFASTWSNRFYGPTKSELQGELEVLRCYERYNEYSSEQALSCLCKIGESFAHHHLQNVNKRDKALKEIKEEIEIKSQGKSHHSQSDATSTRLSEIIDAMTVEELRETLKAIVLNTVGVIRRKGL